MKTQIGSTYESTKQRLREMIRKGCIQLETKKTDRNYACYFCLNYIDGNVLILKNPNEDMTHYPIDNSCYRKAKLFVYFRNVPISLN